MIRGMTSVQELPSGLIIYKSSMCHQGIELKKKKKLPQFCLVYWKNNATLPSMHSPGLLSRSYLNVDSLDDTGDDVEHLHFCVALRYLLQQLEEEPKYGLQVLQRRKLKS